MNNRLLFWARLTLKLFMGLDLLFIAVLLGAMLLWPFEPAFMDQVDWQDTNGVLRMQWTEDQEPLNALGALDGGHFYFLCVKALLSAGLLFFILRYVLKIIASVRHLETFRSQNVRYFQNIGKLFFIWLAVAFFHLSPLPDGEQITLSLELKYAVCALAAFVLAEVFKEGNRLEEENKLTI